MFKTKKEEHITELYKPQQIEIKLEPQPENKLNELEKESKILSIRISEYFITKKNIFSSKFTCKIECPELNSAVIRSLEDFDWLKSQFNEKYPMIYIPPILNKKNMKDPESISRFIQKFFMAVLRRKILKKSQLLLDFLTIEKFEEYKQEMKEFKLSPKMENYKSTKETLKYDFNVDLGHITQDFQFLNKHMKEASEIFGGLYKNAKDTDQSEHTKKVLEKLKTVFNDCAAAYHRQSQFFEKDMKEFFNYIDMEINEMNVLFTQFNKKKNEYENLGVDYLNKREKLFNEKKYNKWELIKEDEAKLDTFKDNKEEAMKYICKEMGINVENLK